MADGSRYVTEVRVRWSDLDSYGHVNNARTITLLEEARVDWLFVDAERHGVPRMIEGVVVSHLEIKYLRPIGFGAVVTVSMGIVRLRTASFTIDYEVHADGELAAKATSVLVPVDPATFKPRRLDEAERTFLTPYVVAP